MLGERHICIISLLCAAIGISMLFFLNAAIEPRKVNINEINEKMIGERIIVAGKVEWVLHTGNSILLTLNDGEKIKVVRFSPSQDERNLAARNSFISVVGKVQTYKNEIEILAEAIMP